VTVVNGEITQLSVSEVETFDQCELKFWFERANDLKPDASKGQDEGTAGHAHLGHYLLTGEKPTGRKLMGKAATGAIVKGDLPKPGHPENDLLVELRFSGQEKFEANCRCGHGPEVHGKKGCDHVPVTDASFTDAECTCDGFNPRWIPLDTKETLWLGGVPWEGFIDLAFRRGPIPTILDHKFFTPCRPEISEDPYHWLKKGSDLLKTVQMPVYAKSQMPYWPDARQWELVHHYVSKQKVDSLMRRAVVTTDQINARCAEIEKTVERMKIVARAKEQTEVTGNRRSCGDYGGCPHQSICHAFKEKRTVQLTPEESAMFGDVPGLDEAPTPTTAKAPPPPAADPFDDVPGLDEPTTDEAPAPTPAKRKMLIVDEPVPGAAPIVPTPTPGTSTAPVVDPVKCGCGEVITSDNGSKLQSGAWKHIGCKLDAPPPPAPKERKGKKTPPPPPESKPEEKAPEAKSTPPVEVITVKPPPPAPATFVGERQSDRDATAAIDAAKAPAAVVEPAKAADALTEVVFTKAGKPTREALANLLENLALLVRSVA